MKYSREDRVKILEYKLIFEENAQIQKEYEEGVADLNYRLSFFREKLDIQKGPVNQKDLYDKMFMGNISKDNATDITIVNLDEQKLTQSASKVSSNEKPWVKKTHRQIVMATHPDRTSGVQSKHLRDELTDKYRIAQNAYNTGIYSDIIMIAFDLNIHVPDYAINEEISPATNSKKKKINKIKNILGWQWYHVPENQRDAELKKILNHYGFKFTDKKVKEAVNSKYVKRKPGQRPESFIKKRKRN